MSGVVAFSKQCGRETMAVRHIMRMRCEEHKSVSQLWQCGRPKGLYGRSGLERETFVVKEEDRQIGCPT